MTPQERDVIAGIFDRLRQASNQPRDPEAERFIADRLREQPYAPYAMAQAVYVQEQALANLNTQVETLQAQVADLQHRAQQAPSGGGGFLSGLFGGGRQAEPARAGAVPAFPRRDGMGGQPSGAWSNASQGQPGAMGMPMQGQPGQQPGPWGQQPMQQPARGGGGFMATALTTAAGVAGGMVVGNMLMNAFNGDKGGAAQAATPAAATPEAGAADAQQAANTDYNDGSSGDAHYQNAANESYDDGSSFSGGDDDSWA